MRHETRDRLAAARRLLAATAPPGPSFLRVSIKGDITPATAGRLRRRLAEAPAARTVFVTVDSIGGDVEAAVDIYRALREHPGRVIANCYRDCQSAAVLPYLAGDIRNAAPTARFMLHAAAARLPGVSRWTAQAHATAAAAIADADAAMRAIVLERTGMPRAVLEGELAHDHDLALQKAISVGIVHHCPGMTPPLDPAWPARARAEMRARKAMPLGADGYRYFDSYLAACAARTSNERK